jgi:hypothetical protein
VPRGAAATCLGWQAVLALAAIMRDARALREAARRRVQFSLQETSKI